jgi:DNA-binding response OmpR family regulator
MAKILIVDDSELIIQMLSEYLKDAGYAVVTAMNSVDAMSTFRREEPDLVIMDLMMPGIDGHTTARLIKQNKTSKDVPIVIFSDLEGEHEKVLSEEVGAIAHLHKGASQDEVLKTVEEALSKRSHG